MTFLEKVHQKIKHCTGTYESNLTRDISVLADDYAVDFIEWVSSKGFKKYSNGWANFSTKATSEKELLEIFKKEKQL